MGGTKAGGGTAGTGVVYEEEVSGTDDIGSDCGRSGWDCGMRVWVYWDRGCI